METLAGLVALNLLEVNLSDTFATCFFCFLFLFFAWEERKWAVHAEDGPKKRNWKIFNIMQFAQSCSKLMLQTSVFER